MSAENVPAQAGAPDLEPEPEPEQSAEDAPAMAADVAGTGGVEVEGTAAEGSSTPAAADPEAVESALDGIEATLDLVEAAIARVDEGTYGTCATCGRPIGRERLESEPTATTCADHDDPATPHPGAGT